MRRVIVIAAAIVGAVVIFAGAILFYAATNLNSIIAERRQTVLDKVSRALGRQVHADDIKVSLGWGILADVTGVQVADDPDISNKPFIEASNVYTRLELIPLLARRIEVTEVVLDKPVIRIVQTRDGTLNVSTLGRKRVHGEEESGEGGGKGGGGGGEGGGATEESPMAEAGRAPSALGSLYVQNFTVNDGTLEFITEGAPQAATVNNIDLKVRDFGFQAPFTIALNFAALSDQQNFDLSATIGPLINAGVIDIDAIPLKGTAKVGPIQQSQLATIPMIAKLIPPKLSISGPVSFDATADGTIQSVKFNVSGDLSAPAIAFGDAFNKPADQPLKISAEGTQTPAGVELTLADVTLGDLDAKATNIKVGGGTTAARVDTNNFDIASLAKTIPALAKYNASGKAEIHTDATVEHSKLSANGTVALAGVGLSIPDQKVPPLSNLSGNITLAGTGADIGPLTFNLGAQQATLKSHVDQFQPLVMSYELTAASMRLADLVPSRPPDEVINQLFAKGTVSHYAGTDFNVDTELTSPSGNLGERSVSEPEPANVSGRQNRAGDAAQSESIFGRHSCDGKYAARTGGADGGVDQFYQYRCAAGARLAEVEGGRHRSRLARREYRRHWKDRQLRRDEADAEGQRQADSRQRQAGRRQRRRPGAEESAAPARDRQPGARGGRQEPSRVVRQPGH